jgi:hypothetical protein
MNNSHFYSFIFSFQNAVHGTAFGPVSRHLHTFECKLPHNFSMDYLLVAVLHYFWSYILTDFVQDYLHLA